MILKNCESLTCLLELGIPFVPVPVIDLAGFPFDMMIFCLNLVCCSFVVVLTTMQRNYR